jgi:hypothetical protein
MTEEIKFKEKTYAIIFRSTTVVDGIHFFTPKEFSQQLGYMNRPKGYVIQPHLHNEVKREVFYTNEVLFIRTGKVKVNFFDNEKIFFDSKILFPGDIILLAFGGHGFEMLEKSEIIEVKQGPYAGEEDKTRFN